VSVWNSQPSGTLNGLFVEVATSFSINTTRPSTYSGDLHSAHTLVLSRGTSYVRLHLDRCCLNTSSDWGARYLWGQFI
jgi:hypothetical protein